MAKRKAALFRYRLLCIINVVVIIIILNQKLSNVSQPFASVRCAFRWAFARTYIWAIKNCKADLSLCSSEAFELAGQCVCGQGRQAGMLLAVPTRHNNGMCQKRGTLCCMLARSLQQKKKGKKRARLGGDHLKVSVHVYKYICWYAYALVSLPYYYMYIVCILLLYLVL